MINSQMLLIMAISLPALSGCAGFRGEKDFQENFTFEVPENWSTVPKAEPFALQKGWLKQFNDPQLEMLVFEALRNNQDLAAAAARMEAFRAQTRIANAASFPTLSGALGASRNQRTSSSGFQLTNPRTTNYSADLITNWELDIWGRLQHRKNAVLADFRSSQSTYRAFQLSIAVQVAKAWYDAIEAKLQKSLLKQTLNHFQHTLDVIEKGYFNGINDALDVRLAKVNVSAAENSYAAQLTRYDDAIRGLQVLLGRYPSSEIRIAEFLPEIDDSIPVGIPSELLTRRPDLIAAQEKLYAFDERLKDEKKNFLPSISLTGTGGTTGEQLKNLFNFNFLVWRIASDLTQPLFEGGRLKAQRKLAKAELDEAIAEYAQSVLIAFNEVEAALSAERNLSTQEAALAKAKEDSHQAEILALEQYQKGLEEIITLLDTQRRTVDLERSLLEVNNLRIQNRFNLFLALGGGFESTE